MNYHLVLLLIAFWTGVVGGHVETSRCNLSVEQPLRVLFIGNSYTYVNDLPWLVEQLASSAGETRRLETRMVTADGATLKSHWQSGGALKAIKEARWDYVVLQEQSMLPLQQPALMREYAGLFAAEIRRAGAQPVFYLTWVRRDRQEQQASLTEAYVSVSKELGARLAPVGPAWQRALKENPRLSFYSGDGSHPSPEGSYLTACVFYALFYGKSPEGVTRRMFSTQFGTPQAGTRIEVQALNESDARIVQRAAWHVLSATRTGT